MFRGNFQGYQRARAEPPPFSMQGNILSQLAVQQQHAQQQVVQHHAQQQVLAQQAVVQHQLIQQHNAMVMNNARINAVVAQQGLAFPNAFPEMRSTDRGRGRDFLDKSGYVERYVQMDARPAGMPSRPSPPRPKRPSPPSLRRAEDPAARGLTRSHSFFPHHPLERTQMSPIHTSMQAGRPTYSISNQIDGRFGADNTFRSSRRAGYGSDSDSEVLEGSKKRNRRRRSSISRSSSPKRGRCETNSTNNHSKQHLVEDFRVISSASSVTPSHATVATQEVEEEEEGEETWVLRDGPLEDLESGEVDGIAGDCAGPATSGEKCDLLNGAWPSAPDKNYLVEANEADPSLGRDASEEGEDVTESIHNRVEPVESSTAISSAANMANIGCCGNEEAKATAALASTAAVHRPRAAAGSMRAAVGEASAAAGSCGLASSGTAESLLIAGVVGLGNISGGDGGVSGGNSKSSALALERMKSSPVGGGGGGETVGSGGTALCGNGSAETVPATAPVPSALSQAHLPAAAGGSSRPTLTNSIKSEGAPTAKTASDRFDAPPLLALTPPTSLSASKTSLHSSGSGSGSVAVVSAANAKTQVAAARPISGLGVPLSSAVLGGNNSQPPLTQKTAGAVAVATATPTATDGAGAVAAEEQVLRKENERLREELAMLRRQNDLLWALHMASA